MQRDLRTVRKLQFRMGHFERGKIVGFQYESGAEIGWHITTLLPPRLGGFRDYWVAGGVFHDVVHTEAIGSRLLLGITSEALVDINQAGKQAVLASIAEWESADLGPDSATLA